MAQKQLTQYKWALLLFVIIGLPSLLWILLRRNRSQAQTIREVLSAKGVPEQTIKFWIAVSAFETASKGLPWNSKVLADSKNLFNQIVPNSVKLSYGEGQTIFNSWRESVESLWARTLRPYKYPIAYNSIGELVDAMKARGFFTSDKEAYKKGVAYWYNKLFANG